MMAPLVPPVPLPRRGGAQSYGAASAPEPAFSAPVRWALRVLAWLAFGVASYLAWHAVTETTVAGCGMGSSGGCDVVLTSPWSKWLGIPVAVLGLACYASLAALSVLLGLRNASAARWITTVFVTLSIAAAAASVWFIGIQVFAIGSFCPYCLVTDICGIAIGVIATAFAIRADLSKRGMPQARAMQPGLMALRTAFPAGNRNVPLAIRTEPSRPLIIPAVAIAAPLIVLLIGGQILLPSKTFDVQKVALTDSIEMVGSKADGSGDPAGTAQPHVAMRVPDETENVARPALTGESTNDHKQTTEKSEPTGDQHATTGSQSAGPPAPPARQRLVKILGGKLTVDTYQHPVIGSPEAPHIVVEMVSYDCPHCHKMYPIIENALERYGDQVALVVMVVPLDKECNKLIIDPAASHQGGCATARLAVGISKLNPSAFAKFHDFLMAGKEKAPAMEQTIPKAYVLADRTRLRDLMRSDEVNKQIEGYIDLFDRLTKQNAGNKEFGLPIQILGDYIMTGSTASEADVFKAWEEHLGVKAR